MNIEQTVKVLNTLEEWGGRPFIVDTTNTPPLPLHTEYWLAKLFEREAEFYIEEVNNYEY